MMNHSGVLDCVCSVCMMSDGTHARTKKFPSESAMNEAPIAAFCLLSLLSVFCWTVFTR